MRARPPHAHACTRRRHRVAPRLLRPLPSPPLPQDVLGEKGRRIRELTSVISKRFGFAEGAVELFAERLANRGLSAQAQAESLKYKLLGGLAVRRACYGIIKFVMESGAKGVEVVVAGKLRGQRAKAMKFRDGYMVKTGNSAVVFQDYATRHVMMRQGIMGACAGPACDRPPASLARASPPPPPPLPPHASPHLPCHLQACASRSCCRATPRASSARRPSWPTLSRSSSRRTSPSSRRRRRGTGGTEVRAHPPS